MASLTCLGPWCWLLAEPLISPPHDLSSVSSLIPASWLGGWQPRRQKQKLWDPLRPRSVSQTPSLLIGQIKTQGQPVSQQEEMGGMAKWHCKRHVPWEGLTIFGNTLQGVRWETLAVGMERQGWVSDITLKMWCFNWTQHSRFSQMNSEGNRTIAFTIWMTSIKVD